jgi:vacuolar-type H+-ATPase subunit H
LKATIGKEAATITALASKVEDLAATIAKDDKDLAAATKIRGEEAADFATEEKELTETIGAVQRAIGILQREMSKAGGAAFVQVKGAASVIQALQALVKASAFSAADASTLTSFVQSSHEAEDNDEAPGAPEAATYTSKSGSIVDVLEDLLDKANEQLDAARKKETSARRNFEMLAQSLKDEIKFSTKDMGEAKKSSASSGEAKSEAEGALAAASKDLGATRPPSRS